MKRQRLSSTGLISFKSVGILDRQTAIKYRPGLGSIKKTTTTSTTYDLSDVRNHEVTINKSDLWRWILKITKWWALVGFIFGLIIFLFLLIKQGNRYLYGLNEYGSVPFWCAFVFAFFGFSLGLIYGGIEDCKNYVTKRMVEIASVARSEGRFSVIRDEEWSSFISNLSPSDKISSGDNSPGVSK